MDCPSFMIYGTVRAKRSDSESQSVDALSKILGDPQEMANRYFKFVSDEGQQKHSKILQTFLQ